MNKGEFDYIFHNIIALFYDNSQIESCFSERHHKSKVGYTLAAATLFSRQFSCKCPQNWTKSSSLFSVYYPTFDLWCMIHLSAYHSCTTCITYHGMAYRNRTRLSFILRSADFVINTHFSNLTQICNSTLYCAWWYMIQCTTNLI